MPGRCGVALRRLEYLARSAMPRAAALGVLDQSATRGPVLIDPVRLRFQLRPHPDVRVLIPARQSRGSSTKGVFPSPPAAKSLRFNSPPATAGRRSRSPSEISVASQHENRTSSSLDVMLTKRCSLPGLAGVDERSEIPE